MASIFSMLSGVPPNPSSDLQRYGKLSRIAGVSVSTPTQNSASYLPPNIEGAYGGNELGIFLRSPVANRLRVNVIRNSPFLGKVGRSIFVLGHEMGHFNDQIPFENSKAYEGRADKYAAQNFNRIAMLLGASPQRARQLYRASPWMHSGYHS